MTAATMMKKKKRTKRRRRTKRSWRPTVSPHRDGSETGTAAAQRGTRTDRRILSCRARVASYAYGCTDGANANRATPTRHYACRFTLCIHGRVACSGHHRAARTLAAVGTHSIRRHRGLLQSPGYRNWFTHNISRRSPRVLQCDKGLPSGIRLVSNGDNQEEQTVTMYSRR